MAFQRLFSTWKLELFPRSCSATTVQLDQVGLNKLFYYNRAFFHAKIFVYYKITFLFVHNMILYYKIIFVRCICNVISKVSICKTIKCSWESAIIATIKDNFFFAADMFFLFYEPKNVNKVTWLCFCLVWWDDFFPMWTRDEISTSNRACPVQWADSLPCKHPLNRPVPICTFLTSSTLGSSFVKSSSSDN